MTSEIKNVKTVDTANLVVDFAASLRNKRKKKATKKPAEETAESLSNENKKNGVGYTYLEMLNRLFDIKDSSMEGKHSSKSVVEIAPPEVSFLGTKKTLWENFSLIAERFFPRIKL